MVSPKLGSEHIRGMARQYPITAASLILAVFSLAGMPLLASFPIRISLLKGLTEVSPPGALLALLGMAGLLLGGLRTLAVLVGGEQNLPWQINESWLQRIFLVIGVVGIVLIGPVSMVPAFLPEYALAFEQFCTLTLML
jgi:formate hydrogenlyase subunit 3/multisubunit Na+/H+ antiporter MnhD subunit